jgi:large subunit ribosomal protein L29
MTAPLVALRSEPRAKKTSFAGKSQADLAELEQKTRKDLFDLQFQHATRKLANTSELAEKRKELARILTAKNQPTA